MLTPSRAIKRPLNLLPMTAIGKSTGLVLDTYNEAMELVRQHARIVAHFHPDRFGGSQQMSLTACSSRGCTGISLRPDYRAEARPRFQVASATNGSARCSEGHTTTKACRLQSAPNTGRSSWSDSPTGRRHALDRAISCFEARAHGLQSRSWVANTRMPPTESVPLQNRTL